MLSVSPSRGRTLSLQNQQRRAVERTQTALTRLGTGKRINAAKDDPAGLVAAEQLRGELTDLQAKARGFTSRRLNLAERGSQLATVARELNDLRGAVVEATGDTLSDDQRKAIQLEIDAAIESLGRLAADETPVELSAVATGGSASPISGDSAEAAAVIETAQSGSGLARAAVAAEERALDYEEQLNQDQQVIVTQTLSMIEDADFAEETAALAAGQILTQSANVALVYSQQAHADLIGSLLDRVDSGGE